MFIWKCQWGGSKGSCLYDSKINIPLILFFFPSLEVFKVYDILGVTDETFLEFIVFPTSTRRGPTLTFLSWLGVGVFLLQSHGRVQGNSRNGGGFNGPFIVLYPLFFSFCAILLKRMSQCLKLLDYYN